MSQKYKVVLSSIDLFQVSGDRYAQNGVLPSGTRPDAGLAAYGAGLSCPRHVVASTFIERKSSRADPWFPPKPVQIMVEFEDTANLIDAANDMNRFLNLLKS